jgi:hypothetical protein
VKSTFNVISDGSSLLGEHRDGACLIGSEGEWLKYKRGCFKTKGLLQNPPPRILIKGATHNIGCSHSPGHLRVSSCSRFRKHRNLFQEMD